MVSSVVMRQVMQITSERAKVCGVGRARGIDGYTVSQRQGRRINFQMLHSSVCSIIICRVK